MLFSYPSRNDYSSSCGLVKRELIDAIKALTYPNPDYGKVECIVKKIQSTLKKIKDPKERKAATKSVYHDPFHLRGDESEREEEITLLRIILKQGDAQLIQKLQAQGVSLNLVEELVHCLEKKFNDKVDLLLPLVNPDAELNHISLLEYAMGCENYQVVKQLIARGANPFRRNFKNANLIHYCDVVMAQLKLDDDTAQIATVADLKAELEQRYEQQFGEKCPPALPQDLLIPKINYYVKLHNEAQTDLSRRITLAVESPNGWCNGLTATWGYLRANPTLAMNDSRFFELLYNIVSTPFSELQSQSLTIEKLIGWVNFLQSRSKLREALGFDARQNEFRDSLGIDKVFQVQMEFDSPAELEQLFREFVLSQPNRFISLAGKELNKRGMHIVGLYFDSEKGQIELYDSSQGIGNKAVRLNDGRMLITPVLTYSLQQLNELASECCKIFVGKNHTLSLNVYVKDEAVTPEAKAAYCQKVIAFYEQPVFKLKRERKRAASALIRAEVEGDENTFLYYLENLSYQRANDINELRRMCALSTPQHFSLYLEKMKALLSMELSTKAKDRINTLFHGIFASLIVNHENPFDRLELLFSYGFDPNFQSKRHDSPFSQCALNNWLEVAKYLISKGAIVEESDFDECEGAEWQALMESVLPKAKQTKPSRAKYRRVS